MNLPQRMIAANLAVIAFNIIGMLVMQIVFMTTRYLLPFWPVLPLCILIWVTVFWLLGKVEQEEPNNG